MLNDKELFGSADKCVITCCEERLDDVLGESGIDSDRYDNFLWSNILVSIQ